MKLTTVCFLASLFLMPFSSKLQAEDTDPSKNRQIKAPSMDQVRWQEAKTSSDFNFEYDFAGGPLNEHYTDVRWMFTRRSLLAFLIHGGFKWQRLGFDGRKSLLLPGQLEEINSYLALDFRWSKKDLLRLQARPGFFSDFENMDINDFNAPVDIAYTRVPNHRIQWAIGMSIDTWRKDHILPGGGFRYALTKNWKLKFMLPDPQIEYIARDNLSVFLGADFRGDSYRLAKNFGTAHAGDPSFDKAVVDYSEIRIGPGFSWNILPLIEFNGQAGYTVERQFDYHNNGVTLHTGEGPFISLMFHWLFKMSPPEKVGPDIESGRFQNPGLKFLLDYF